MESKRLNTNEIGGDTSPGSNTMKCPHCQKEFTDPGRSKGGKTSKRKITTEQQQKMQAARKEKAK